VDLHPPHLDCAQEVLAAESLEDTFSFLQGDGARVIEGLTGPFNLVLLDSDSDSRVTEREYLALQGKLQDPGFVVIDDIGRNGVNKGALVLAQRTKDRLPWKQIAQYVACIPIGPQATRALDLL
jgi:predicted O-methyltransferase YrrM